MRTLPQYHDAAALAEAIAQRCEHATLKGKSWQACCPHHDDSHPSLSITARGDKVLLHCHAGCTSADIVAALGLTLGDLFVSPPSSNGHKRIVHIYPYVDAQGHLIHETVRYDPKDFKQRRPDPAKPGEYLWSLQGIEPVLYNLSAVLAAIAQGDLVHLAEGEKDAETLIALGLVATTVPMGAKYWRDSYTTTLTGAHVALWPDNDAAGHARVTKVQRVLTGKAKSLRIVPVPGPHKDVSDWITAGGTRAELDALVQAHTPPAPLAASLVSGRELLALTVPPKAPYLDWLTARALAMVYGPRGVGKTYWLLELALCLTMPRPFLKWPVQQQVSVLFVDGEMALESLQKRLRQLAGEHLPSALHFLPSELVYARSGRDLTLTVPADRLAIDAMLEEHHIKVLILDNISCLFPGLDESKKQDWEPINAWLIRWRHRGLTVIVGHHAGKNGQQRGTSGREDHLDTIIALTLPPGHQAEDGCHVHMRFEKSRGVKGPTVEALDVRLEDSPHGQVWTIAPLDAKRHERIKTMLEDGMPAKLIADELAISPSYVYRCKRELGL